MGQKMGKKGKKGDDATLAEQLLDCYIRSEFKAMDTDSDGSLHRQEVIDLLTMLGYSKATKKLKQLHVKSEDHVDLEAYVTAFKADKELIAKTMNFRQLFQQFDTNEDGTASKEEMAAGLEKIDIKVDEEMQKTIENMDANEDGKITYEEFLAMQFQMALNKGGKQEKKGKKEKKEKKPKKEKKLKKDHKKSKKSKKDDDSDSESGKEKDEKDGVEKEGKEIEETAKAE